MAGALTPKQRGALILKWGTVENAIDESLRRSPELRELWATQHSGAWWPYPDDFWKAWWEDALPVLGIETGEAAVPVPVDRRREGKDYPGVMVEEVVRQATIAQHNGNNLGRTLRNELYPKIDGATTYAVDAIFRLMKRGMLADAGRDGWLKVAGDLSATPRFINLLDLESRS